MALTRHIVAPKNIPKTKDSKLNDAKEISKRAEFIITPLRCKVYPTGQY
jgi:hypothetical protein